jgi:hypothetical protein
MPAPPEANGRDSRYPSRKPAVSRSANSSTSGTRSMGTPCTMLANPGSRTCVRSSS